MTALEDQVFFMSNLVNTDVVQLLINVEPLQVLCTFFTRGT